MDRELGVIQARQNDIQRVTSNVREILSRVQYELATVQQTVQEAEEDRAHRAEEKAAEQKALAAAREEVVSLKAKDRKLTEHLINLRDQFTTARNENLNLVGKADQVSLCPRNGQRCRLCWMRCIMSRTVPTRGDRRLIRVSPSNGGTNGRASDEGDREKPDKLAENFPCGPRSGRV